MRYIWRCFVFFFVCFFRLKIIAPMDTIRDLQTNCLSQFSHKWHMQCVVQPRSCTPGSAGRPWLAEFPLTWLRTMRKCMISLCWTIAQQQAQRKVWASGLHHKEEVSHLTQPLCRVAAGSLRSILGFHWRTIIILMDEYLFVCIYLSCSFYFVVKCDFPNTVWTRQFLYEPVAFKIIKVLILW